MGDLPAWMGGPAKRREQNRRSQRQERNRAKEIGGRTTPGSGSSRRAPQDVVNGEYLEQLKYTSKASYSVKITEWRQLRKDALSVGKEPRMVIDFEEEGVRIIITEG